MAGGRPRANPAGKRCAFCNYRGQLTGEHIWPERLKALFDPQLVMVRAERADVKFGGVVIPMDEWEMGAFKATVEIDCDQCNNVILNQIEEDATPYVLGMASGGLDGGLQLVAQRKIAAFVFRMFSVGQYTHPSNRPIPRGHRRHLVLHKAPPLYAEVWLSSYDGEDLGYMPIQAGSHFIAGPGEQFPGLENAYMGIFRFGHLIAQLAARTDGLPFPVIPNDPRTYVRVWPIDLARIAVWPPERALTRTGWDAKTKAMRAFST